MLKKVLIIAGGTGGHIFPALVVADAFEKEGVEVSWLGASTGMERQLVPDCYPIVFLPIKGLRGKRFFSKLLAPWRLFSAIFLACRAMRKINPDLVLGMGGYASGPGGIAAWLLRKPLVIHEQNAVAGLTNRILTKFSRVIFQAFPGAFSNNKRAVTVGNPVRPAVLDIADPTIRFAHREKPLRVLVLGGSQGALAINQLILATIPKLINSVSLQFWHQAGQRDFISVQTAYQQWSDMLHRVDPFIEDMAAAYTWADVVICRAGALTVTELAAAGLPSLLIPFPFAVDDHQMANALSLQHAQAGIVMAQKTITPEKLAAWLKDMVDSPKLLREMAVNAKKLARADTVSTMIAACRQVVD